VGVRKNDTENEEHLENIQAVEFRAELRQVRTMVDGTVNILLNLPEYCLPQVKVILDWMNFDLRVMVENDRQNS